MTPFSEWKITSRSGGTQSATPVGMPMPRLTNQPSGMSCAMRAAMPARSSGFAIMETASVWNVDDAVHEDAGGMDMRRRDGAKRHDMTRLYDGHPRRHRHHRIEVP